MKRKTQKQKYWKHVDPWFLGIVLALIVFGLVAVSSASAVVSFQLFSNNYHFFLRQLTAVVFGLLLCLLLSKIDYHIYSKWSRLIVLGAVLFLLIVHIPGIGLVVGGSRSWINTGFFLIQPSEFAKLAIIIYLASWFDRKREAETNFWFGVLPPLSVVGLLLGLTAVQPDIGTATVMAVIIFTMLFVAGTRWQYLSGLSLTGVVALWFVIHISPSKANRFITFLDPTLDPKGIGYQINQALLAIGSGGFWGYGFGNSRQKHSYLPEPISDSIFAVMAEEFGFVRIVLLVVALLFLALRGLYIARSAPDRLGLYMAVGITSWICFQALINVGAITGMMPFTGVTLPFVSYGGSSMLALCMAVGVMLNISRQRESTASDVV